MSTKTPLNENISVQEHIVFWSKCIKNRKANLSKLLLKFAQEDLLNKTPDKLSWGQKKRLILSILNLMSNKTIFLLDEPFTGLDKENKKKLSHICCNHIKNNGIVIVSHHGNLPFQATKIFTFPVFNNYFVDEDVVNCWEVQ